MKVQVSSWPQIIIGGMFLVFSVVLLIFDPSSISSIVSVSLKEQTFGGNLSAFTFSVAVLFLWLGSQKKKDPLEEAKQALNDAAERVSGKIGTLHVRIGPDALQNIFRQHVSAGTLSGKYRITQRGKLLQSGQPNLYEDSTVKVLLAEIKDVFVDQDCLIEIILTDGENEWSASESIKVRRFNFLSK